MVLLPGLGQCLVDGDNDILLAGLENYNMGILNPACPWVTVDRLSVSQYPRWALVNSEYLDPDHSGGDVNVYVFVKDENGNLLPGANVVQQNGGVTDLYTKSEPGKVGEVDFAQSGNSAFDPATGKVGPYSVWIRDRQNAYPSERVWGLGLPALALTDPKPKTRHVAYKLTFQKVLTAQPQEGQVRILNVSLSPQSLPTNEPYGMLLKVELTVKNETAQPMQTQGPEPGFKYLESESYATRGYPEKESTYRVAVEVDSNHTTVDHPWRWGFGTPIQPGETRTLTGYIEWHTAGQYKFWAGLVQEQVRWVQDDIGTVDVTVTEVPPIPPDDNPDLDALTVRVQALEAALASQAAAINRIDNAVTLIYGSLDAAAKALDVLPDS